MLHRITAPTPQSRGTTSTPSARQAQTILIQHLKDAGLNISEAQEQSFFGELNVPPLERLINIGILGPDHRQVLNTLFLEAIEQGSARACTLLFLGANPILQDSSANNILHLILKSNGTLKENLIKLLLSLFHFKDAPPMYLLNEKNTKGQTPLDLAKQHTPDFTKDLLAYLTDDDPSVQRPAWVKTLSNLLLKNDAPHQNANELALHFENAANENEKNALLELARLKIELQEQAPAANAAAIIEDLLQRASLAGLAEADYLLGKHVYTDDAVKRKQAFERACEKNHGKAQFEMARCLIAEAHDIHTRELCFDCAKKAADQGVAQAEEFAIRTAIELALHYQLQGSKEAAKTSLEYAAQKKTFEVNIIWRCIFWKIGTTLMPPGEDMLACSTQLKTLKVSSHRHC